jgi:hypothetical protein
MRQREPPARVPDKLETDTMKYCVFANMVTGLNLYSRHRTKAAAEKAAKKAGKSGVPFVVRPIAK